MLPGVVGALKRGARQAEQRGESDPGEHRSLIELSSPTQAVDEMKRLECNVDTDETGAKRRWRRPDDPPREAHYDIRCEKPSQLPKRRSVTESIGRVVIGAFDRNAL